MRAGVASLTGPWNPKEAGCRAGGFARRREHTATANPFPSPKVWLATADGDRFLYRCKLEYRREVPRRDNRNAQDERSS
jgi:hypothetical protein